MSSKYQRCTEFEIFDSDSAPAEYTPTPLWLQNILKFWTPTPAENSKVNYLKAVAIDAPVDLEIWKLIHTPPVT